MTNRLIENAAYVAALCPAKNIEGRGVVAPDGIDCLAFHELCSEHSETAVAASVRPARKLRLANSTGSGFRPFPNAELADVGALKRGKVAPRELTMQAGGQWLWNELFELIWPTVRVVKRRGGVPGKIAGFLERQRSLPGMLCARMEYPNS